MGNTTSKNTYSSEYSGTSSQLRNNAICSTDCGKCCYFLSNNKYISKLDIVSMVSIFDILATESFLYPENRIIPEKSTITCTGDVTIKYTYSASTANLEHNRIVCFRVIDEWIHGNKHKVYDAFHIMYVIICASILYYPDNEQRASQVLNNLEAIDAFVRRYIKHIGK